MTGVQTCALPILKGAGNIALNVVGNLAAIYNLGFGTVKNAASESTFVKNGDFAF